MLLRCISYLSQNSDINARRYLENVGNEDIIERCNIFVDRDNTKHQTEKDEEEKKKTTKKNKRSPTVAQRQVLRYIHEFTKKQESQLQNWLWRLRNRVELDPSTPSTSSREEFDLVLDDE
jgi:hypothetical protein